MDLFPVSDQNCLAQFKSKDVFAPIIPNSSVLIGAMVTSYARIQLFRAMENVSQLYGPTSLLCKF